jgi:hypothetical protein
MATRQMMALGMLVTLGMTGAAHAQLPGQLTPETTVKLVLVDRLHSGSSREGDRINFRVDEDIADANGQVLVRKGTAAYGTVTKSRRSKGFGRRGLLDFSVDYTTAVDGQRVPLRCNGGKSGKSGSRGALATTMFVSAVGGFFIKGSNVSMEPGVTLMAFVDQTVTVGQAPGVAPTGVPGGVLVAAGPRKVLVLRNGDRMTGSLQSLANGVYTVVTMAGTLRVAEADVKEIKDVAAAPAVVRQVKGR